MTSIGASANLVALVQASTILPIMLFSLMAGAIADNFDRCLLMLAAQIFLLAVSIALTLCAYFGLVTPPGCCSPSPSWSAAAPPSMGRPGSR
jgi:MFS family permease